ncbi:MAG: DUF692 domain-containing protein [Propionivibrio sp.]|uniref:UPF0276 protein IPJ48_20010 n=1 Tax=Candidatus Propionivibrio dominans TaxID=2954373 RepID=A0A9D7FNT7_9RHOO|nr:DUF692 domain-containing protein [Candidatus Propionivibrio dominans]
MPSSSAPAAPVPSTRLPLVAGIGLRAPHHAQVLAERPAVAWWEVHSENFFSAGGAPIEFLHRIRQDYPLSLHGVGLSLGALDTLFEAHLAKLAALVERIEPVSVSEHLCWSSAGARHFNDLLPLPYTEAALEQAVARIERVQERLQRPILVENVSSYLQFADSMMSEWDFLVAVARRSGCGILLDINNIYVSACNHGFSAQTYIDAIPADLVGELHLAGFEACEDFLIDTHGQPVHSPVWDLYEYALGHLGAKPTLIEWDVDIPSLAVLQGEAAQAEQRLRARMHNVSASPLEPGHALAA